MGIKYLGRIIKETGVTKQLDLSYLSSKRIAIDCSFIIYKFWYMILYKELKKKNIMLEELNENDLINKLIHMLFGFIKRFNKYEIEPIFVFDGTPPVEKINIINNRKSTRQKSMENYEELRKNFKDKNKVKKDDEEKNEIYQVKNNKNNHEEKNEDELEIIKQEAEKKFLQSLPIPMHTIQISIKLFLETLGIEFYQAKGEAEKLCTALVLKGLADAVFSSDTDNLVLGCPMLIIEIKQEKIKVVELKELLEKLELNYEDFKLICILSGCDYNKNISNVGFKTIKKEFKKLNCNKECLLSFLIEKYGPEAVKNLQVEKCLDLFTINNLEECVEEHTPLKKIDLKKLEKLKDIFDLKL